MSASELQLLKVRAAHPKQPAASVNASGAASLQPDRGWSIRPVREEDLSAIMQLDPVIFPPTAAEPAWDESTFRRFWGKRYSWLIWEESSQSILGYVFMSKGRDGSFHIGNVGTHPQHRGRGVAQRLMGTALEHAQHDATVNQDVHFSLRVRADNAPAIRVYEKQGFKMQRPARPGRDSEYLPMRATRKGLEATKQNILSTGAIIFSSASTTREKFLLIVDTLLTNIRDKTGGRWTSGSGSDKCLALNTLRTQIDTSETDSCERPEYRQETVASLRRICGTKRNSLHFWQTPHSVAELDALLLSAFNGVELRAGTQDIITP